MKRRTELKRKSYLKRSSPKWRAKKSAKTCAPRISFKRITPERAAERREYADLRERYLREHPICQIWIAEHGLDEAALLRELDLGHGSTLGAAYYSGERVPFANQIHHRNKCRGARLTDERWIMSVSQKWHDEVEGKKGWARERGYLLPIQADAEGRWGAGNQALTTPELMASRAPKRPPAVPF
jgi:hypothetical protein